MLLHNHPSGVLEPSGADLAVAARLHDDGVGFGIVNNEVTELYVVVECPRRARRGAARSRGAARLLGSDGPRRAGAGRGFEDRPASATWRRTSPTRTTTAAWRCSRPGPASASRSPTSCRRCSWAQANGERTVVSTNTINLQEQLVGKDLPMLARALAHAGPRPTLRAAQGVAQLPLPRPARAGARRAGDAVRDRTARRSSRGIAAWASRTADGSLADLADEPSDDVWDAVAAESDLCTRLKCPHFERCFVFQARRRAAEADVVVVNHHLLASDLAVRLAADNWLEAAVLPPYRRLMLDEAHHLEDVAAAHLGAQVSQLGVQRLLARLERGGRGLLPALHAELAARDDLLSAASRDLLEQRLLDALRAARRAPTSCSRCSTRRLDASRDRRPCCGSPRRSRTIRCGRKGWAWRSTTCLTAFGGLRDGVETIADRLSLQDGGERPAALVGELRGVVRRLDLAARGLTAACGRAGTRPTAAHGALAGAPRQEGREPLARRRAARPGARFSRRPCSTASRRSC